MEAKLITLATRVEPELHEQLKRVAKAEDRPVSSVLRRAVVQYVEQAKGKPPAKRGKA